MAVRMFYDHEVVDAIHKLSVESAKVKNEIFKSSIMKRGIDDNVLKTFISYINSFLKQWDDHCADLAREMASSSGIERVRTLEYAFAKDYIYAEYDYAAILQFTDGVMKGLISGRFTEPADIEKFYSHTVNKAFDDQPDTAAGVIESVLHKNLYETAEITADKYQAKMYDTIKKYKNIHNPGSRVELYKASVGTIDFIRNDLNIKESFNYDNMRLFISAINNIIDFIIYSITVFVARIYVISQYAGPYLRSETVHPFRESSSIENVKITTMKDMDNLLTHDNSRAKEFINILSQFVSDIGADGLFNGKPEYGSFIDNSEYQKSEFCHKLISNPLVEFVNQMKLYFPFTRDTSSSINDYNNTLKSITFNQYQGIQGMSTAKQEIMHVIRGVGSDAKTQKELQKLAMGLYTFALRIIGTLDNMIYDLLCWKKEESERPRHSLADINKVSECIKILGELYRDITSAIAEKAKDIEVRYNNALCDEVNKISNEICIKVPGTDKVINKTSSISNVVPDTLRMPMELMDLYSLPAFESAQMYNEYLRTLPEFETSYYLNESVLGDIINALLSLLDGLRRRVDGFFNNKSTKQAMQWVKDHRNELDSITFSNGDKMDNTIIFRENITLPSGYENLVNGIKNFTEKNAESADTIAAFIKSLYPNETVYKWFTSEDTKKNAHQMFSILFLCNTTLEEIDSKKSTTLITGTVSGADYQKHFKMWVDTVSNGPEIYEQYKRIDDEIRNNVKSLKNKIVQLSSDESKNKSTTGSTISQNSAATAQTGGSTTSNDNKDNSSTDSAVDKTKENQIKVDGQDADKSSTANITTEVKNVINNIWSPIGKEICAAIQKQYKYIKDTYTAKKSASQQKAGNDNSNQ